MVASNNAYDMRLDVFLDNLAVEVTEETHMLPPTTSKDTTASQVDSTMDHQGIPWDRLQFSRESFRQQRIELYRNYTNVVDLTAYSGLRAFHQQELGASLTQCPMAPGIFTFYRNFRDVQTSIVHFQLRNLLWATSSHDLYVVHNNSLKHWNLVRREHRTILDLSGGPNSSPNMGVVYVSTACVSGGFAAAGGFNGELVMAQADRGEMIWHRRVAQSENCITNALEVSQSASGGWTLLAANNDNKVRILEATSGRPISEIALGWASNCAATNPQQRNLIAVVGDDKDVHLFDASTNRAVCALSGHLDWTFAAAWHPVGQLLATGNQDCTTRVWDIRYPGEALAVLPARMGSIRTCRFSPDGRLLAVGEPADFVHVYDVAGGLVRGQSVDVFGEISGIAFAPDSAGLFMGVTDQMYNSVLAFVIERPEEPDEFD